MALYQFSNWVLHFVGFLLQNHLPAGDSFNEEPKLMSSWQQKRERKWGFPEQRVVEHSVEEADDDEP